MLLEDWFAPPKMKGCFFLIVKLKVYLWKTIGDNNYLSDSSWKAYVYVHLWKPINTIQDGRQNIYLFLQ